MTLKKPYIIDQIETIKSNLVDIAINSAIKLGLKCDGITDDTTTLISVANARDNQIIRFPANTTTIISSRIQITKNKVVLEFEEGAKIKFKDGALQTNITNGLRTFGMFELYGIGCGIRGGEIDGNILNNGITYNGKTYYINLPGTAGTDAYIPTETTFGYSGVGLSNDYCFVENCNVHDMGWSGIVPNSSNPNGTNKSSNTVGKRVVNCTISKCGQDFIPITFSNKTYVYGNTIINPPHHGIHDYLSNVGNIVEKNIITMTRANCFEAYPSQLVNDCFGAMAIDHEDYRDTEVSGTVMRGNIISGDFYVGIYTYGYPRNFTIEQNVITGNGTTSLDEMVGIFTEAGFFLGNNVIRNNTIKNVFSGILFHFNAISRDWYPTYNSMTINDFTFNLEIYENELDNCKNSHITSRVDSTNITTHLKYGKINIHDNQFKGTSVIPSYCIYYGTYSKGLNQLVIFAENNLYTYSTAITDYYSYPKAVYTMGLDVTVADSTWTYLTYDVNTGNTIATMQSGQLQILEQGLYMMLFESVWGNATVCETRNYMENQTLATNVETVYNTRQSRNQSFAIMYLNKNDVVRTGVKQISGGNLTLSKTGTRFTLTKIG